MCIFAEERRFQVVVTGVNNRQPRLVLYVASILTRALNVARVHAHIVRLCRKTNDNRRAAGGR